MERAAGEVDRTEGRRIGLIAAGGAVITEPPCRVGDHVVAVASEPAVVPVPLVRSIPLVGRRLPLVLVVSEAMEHEDQGMGGAGTGRRLRQIDVELRPVEAGYLSGADLDAPIGGALTLGVLVEIGGDRGCRGGRASGSEPGCRQTGERADDREIPPALLRAPPRHGARLPGLPNFQSVQARSSSVDLFQHRWMDAADCTTSKAEPGIDLSWSRFSSGQRRSEVPEMNQLEPLSATIAP